MKDLYLDRDQDALMGAPVSKCDVCGKPDSDGHKHTRKEARTNWRKTLVVEFKARDGAVVNIGTGTVKGGRATRWAIICSRCGIMPMAVLTKDQAARLALGHTHAHDDKVKT